MSAGREQRIAVGGAALHVEVSGSGAPLLLLHGFTGSAATWKPFADSWPERQMVAVDLLGHGGADAPADEDRYRIERMVEDLVLVLDRLGLPSAVVLGYSMGGRVALHLALTAPERVQALILESASPGIAEASERAARVVSDRALADRIEGAGIAAFVREWEALPMWASQLGLGEETRLSLRAQRLGQSTVGLANSLRGMGAGAERPVLDRLGELTAPTLLVCGGLDKKYCDFARAIGERMREVRVVRVEGCGHAVHLEAPERFAAVVGEFLASLPSS